MNKRKLLDILVTLIIIILVVYGVKKQDVVLLLYLTAFTLLYYLLWHYEQQQASSRRLVLLGTMVSIAVVSRMLFFFIPGFSPMVSLIILSGLFLGKDFGLMTGLLCPLISNLIYGQGPWTPFQMLILGLVGFLVGTSLLRTYLPKSRWFLSFYGVLAGMAFSMVMDIWTVYSMDGFFSFKRYVSVLLPSLTFMLSYISSNVLFLNAFIQPMGEKLKRVKDKYQL